MPQVESSAKCKRTICSGCSTNRHQLVPVYPSCKKERLCELVDPGLLSFAYLDSLEDYKQAHDRLLRGVSELETAQHELLPGSDDDFVWAVLKAHRTLFTYALPHIAGRFRHDWENVSFGGHGPNMLDGVPSQDIEEGVRRSFKLATMPGWTTERRAASFLERFFRVHPFSDGNGRIARFFVQKICRMDRKVIPTWTTTGKSRRKYLYALEFAHRHYNDRREQALIFLERWLLGHMVTIDEDNDPTGLGASP
jgi:fido (protein-threonine AMPylation protein)